MNRGDERGMEDKGSAEGDMKEKLMIWGGLFFRGVSVCREGERK